MKKDTLYRVNKWNTIGFNGHYGLDRNLYGGLTTASNQMYNPFGVSLSAPTVQRTIDWSNPAQRAAAIGTSAGLVSGFSDMANAYNPFNNGNIAAKSTGGVGFNALKGAAGALAGALGGVAYNGISGGYDTGGIGQGVASVGSTLGSAIGTVNPLVGAAVSFGSNLIGGVINRGWGVKENKENVAAIKQNTAEARAAGNALAGSSTSQDFFNNAGQMTVGSGFSAGDLYKNGWWTSKGTRKGEALINKENNALAFQNHGMVLGAENVDSNLDDYIMSNYAAYGGYFPSIGIGTEDMPAVNYGMWQDWLNSRRQRGSKQSVDSTNDVSSIGINMYEDGGPMIKPSHRGMLTELKKRTGKTEAELKHDGNPAHKKMVVFAENARKWKHADGGPLFAIGGDMQTNGADYSTGLTYVNAGGSHEENPNDGVQMGVDQEGVPNLVEEGEVVFNDYVYSARIELDTEAKRKFHFPKKKDITYADAAKKLEKEIKERPNDPISKAGFKAQMESLAEEQERQKAEMEAARAREAFEALSPDEQVAVMQQAAQQEQMAQEQAMQEQVMAQEAAAQQQPVEAPEMAQQAPMEQPVGPEAMGIETVPQEQVAAYGGNLFGDGGVKDALAWLDSNYPNIKNKEQIAAALSKAALANKNKYYGVPDSSFFSSNKDRQPTYRFDWVWRDLTPIGNINVDKHLRKWIDLGVSKDAAFDALFQGEDRNALWVQEKYNNFDYTPASSVQSSTNIPKRAVTRYRYNGKMYNTREEAEQARAAAHNGKAKSVTPVTSTTSVTTTNNAPMSAKAVVENAVAQQQKKQTKLTVPDNNAKIDAAINEWWSNPKEFFAKRGIKTESELAQSPEQPVEESRSAAVTRGTSGSRQPVVSEDKGINVGTWRQEGNHWNEYGLPGLQNYLTRATAALNDPSYNDEQRAQLRQDIVNTINGIQESYYNNIVPTLNNNRQNRSDAVEQHQKMYQAATNNAGFYGVDDEGRYYNKMDMALNKPEGHHTTDNLATGWVDGYSGPQTWLRHMGASGDGLNAVVKQLKDLGIDYSPYNSWNIGEGDNARQLYRASIIGDASGSQTQPADKSFAEEYPLIARPVDDNTKGQSVAAQYGAPWAPENAGKTAGTTGTVATAGTGNGDNNPKIIPIHKADWLRYAGLFGPAVGLGMQLAGVGRPDNSALNGVLEAYDRRGTATMSPKYIGNYLAYRPMDIWFEQNRLNANSRATDRAISNTSSPSKMAGLLANAYNNQIASGDLYRKALEYNDAKRAQTAEFNRGTDMFNAQAYNQAQQFNAQSRNSDRNVRAQLASQIASQKQANDANWYNSLYGNVAGLFKGVADLGRENYQYNQMVDLLGTGALPGITDKQLVKAGYYRYAKDGGKIKKNKKNLMV